MIQLNKFTDEKKESELKVPNSEYREKDFFQMFSKVFKRQTLSLFNMNARSHTKIFDDFNILCNDLNVSFDILQLQNHALRKIRQALQIFS